MDCESHTLNRIVFDQPRQEGPLEWIDSNDVEDLADLLRIDLTLRQD
jgi:hypothetical protein